MSTPATVHSGIVDALADAGFTEAPTPWTLDSFPSSLADGGYLLLPVSDDTGAPTSGGTATGTITLLLAVPWVLTADPSTKARACMAAVDTIRGALHGAHIDSALIDVTGVDYATSDDGHRLVASLTLTATGTYTF